MADKIYSTVAVPTGTLFMHIHVHCINLHVYDFINWCFVGDIWENIKSIHVWSCLLIFHKVVMFQEKNFANHILTYVAQFCKLKTLKRIIVAGSKWTFEMNLSRIRLYNYKAHFLQYDGMNNFSKLKKWYMYQEC